MLTRSPAVLVMLCLAAAGCTASRVSAEAAQLPEVNLQGEQLIFRVINDYRESRRLPALSYSRTLARIAREHSRAMADGEVPFSHDGLDNRAALAGRRFSVLDFGENLVAMQPASEFATWRAVAGWLDSESHRTTLEGCFDLTGVGIARGTGGRVYITQIFVLRLPRYDSPVRHARSRCVRQQSSGRVIDLAVPGPIADHGGVVRAASAAHLLLASAHYR